MTSVMCQDCCKKVAQTETILLYYSHTVTSKTLDNNLFERKVNLHAFLKRFESAAAGIFGREPPSDGDLKAPAVARVFSSVLRTGSVADIDFTSEDDTSTLQQCFRNGWLHTDKFLDDGIKYFFPSSLHRWYVEWKLWDVASA
jgi:hypothetical protein